MGVLTLPIWKTSTCLTLPFTSPDLTRCAGSTSSASKSLGSAWPRIVQSSRAGSSNRTAGAVETGGFRPPTYTLDWDEPFIVGP